jgi:ketosteroid isomerase-like protein
MSVTPREIFELMRRQWFGRPGPLTGEFLADDVVIESPFAPPGRPTRVEGREEFLASANPQRAVFPIRFDDCRVLTVHDTVDPETIVVEYELTATSTRTGQQATAAFIGVLTVRDGKVVLWREYQNTLAIQQAVA